MTILITALALLASGVAFYAGYRKGASDTMAFIAPHLKDILGKVNQAKEDLSKLL